ncbi:hypothetical protein AB0I10_19435 [Streptomyces sp. NPDC050636]|uniref:hypothetical protein n=1 Tax=Streptomyces sp. NPDC050636 TaxID=3154510 RepID=UPI003416882F
MSRAAPGLAGRLRRLGSHEGRWLVSLVWWVARRRIGVAAGDRPFGYAAAQAAIVYGLTFVCVVETVGLAVLLTEHPVTHLVMLVIDVYTVLMMLGMQAAAVTRPHVLGADTLLLRDGARMEVRIPLERIASVRYDLRFTKTEKKKESKGVESNGEESNGEEGNGVASMGVDLVELAVAGQTSVTVELSEPVTAVRLLGRRSAVRTVRFHADDARGAVAAVREAVEATGAAAPPAAGGQAAFTRG